MHQTMEATKLSIYSQVIREFKYNINNLYKVKTDKETKRGGGLIEKSVLYKQVL